MEECLITLSHMGYLSEINNFEHLVSIVKRLPPQIQNKWSRIAGDRELRGEQPQFQHLVELVKFEATMESTMFCRTLGTKKQGWQRSNVKPPQRDSRVSTHVSSVSAVERPMQPPRYGNVNQYTCLLCEGQHRINNCKLFANKSVDERLNIVRKEGLCFSCLQKSCRGRCNMARPCNVSNCTKRHHTLLHIYPKERRPTTEFQPNQREKFKPQQKERPVVTSTSFAAKTEVDKKVGQQVYMNIVPVKVIGNNGQEIETYAFLDSGSNATMCTQKLVDTLGVKGDKIKFTLSTVQGETRNNNGSCISLSVRALDGREAISLQEVIVIDDLPVTPNKCERDWHHLREIKFVKPAVEEVLLLIGANVPEVFVDEQWIHGEDGEPSAVRSVLGWSLFGNASTQPDKERKWHISVNRVSLCKDALHEQVKKMWETEFKNSGLDSGVGLSKEDKYALKMLNESAKFKDGHYQLSLPWCVGSPSLPNNRQQAVQRLSYLQRRLRNDSNLREKYSQTMNGYVKSGYAQQITEEEDDAKGSWYLPHHPVLHPQKPGKVRVVFDCAAKYRGTSLNDQLLQGPDLMNSLVGVLLRFRQEPVALVADVEAMFHQVKVKSEDTDYLRFIWWPGGDMSKEPVDHKMLVHLFGATSSPCCANYCLRRTADDNAVDFDEETVSTVHRNFYVDDCLKSMPTVSQAKRLVNQLRELLKRGGFTLKKWLSNKEEVLDSVPEEHTVKKLCTDSETSHLERVLGVSWDHTTDVFQFDVSVKKKPITRRGILSVVSSLFDPLGFVAPVVLYARMILQELCKQKLGWDEEIPEDLATRWQQWITELPGLASLRIERCLKPIIVRKLLDMIYIIF
ncbi:uncharacterized protein LOC144746832 [Ciona intestinalis]